MASLLCLNQPMTTAQAVRPIPTLSKHRRRDAQLVYLEESTQPERARFALLQHLPDGFGRLLGAGEESGTFEREYSRGYWFRDLPELETDAAMLLAHRLLQTVPQAEEIGCPLGALNGDRVLLAADGTVVVYPVLAPGSIDQAVAASSLAGLLYGLVARGPVSRVGLKRLVKQRPTLPVGYPELIEGLQTKGWADVPAAAAAVGRWAHDRVLGDDQLGPVLDAFGDGLLAEHAALEEEKSKAAALNPLVQQTLVALPSELPVAAPQVQGEEVTVFSFETPQASAKPRSSSGQDQWPLPADDEPMSGSSESPVALPAAPKEPNPETQFTVHEAMEMMDEALKPPSPSMEAPVDVDDGPALPEGALDESNPGIAPRLTRSHRHHILPRVPSGLAPTPSNGVAAPGLRRPLVKPASTRPERLPTRPPPPPARSVVSEELERPKVEIGDLAGQRTDGSQGRATYPIPPPQAPPPPVLERRIQKGAWIAICVLTLLLLGKLFF